VTLSLRTSRLLLRQWREDDIAPATAMFADPAVMQYLSALSERGLSVGAWVARQRAHWAAHGFGQWVVELSGAANFIGVVGLETVSYEAHFTPAVEVAWRLAHDYWGQGYATEAARAAVACGFEQLRLGEIVAVTAPANRRSRRVMERLGMTRSPDDDFDHPGVPAGPLKRCVLYRLRSPEAGTAHLAGRRG